MSHGSEGVFLHQIVDCDRALVLDVSVAGADAILIEDDLDEALIALPRGHLSSRARKPRRLGRGGGAAPRWLRMYSAIRHGVAFEVVSEKWTTQTCSDCGSIGGPKGIAGLGMRHWTCSD